LDAVIAADACATDFKGCIGAPADLRGLKVLAPRRWIDGPLAEGNAAALALAKAALTAAGAYVVEESAGFDVFLDACAAANLCKFGINGPVTGRRRLEDYLHAHEVTQSVDELIESEGWPNLMTRVSYCSPQSLEFASLSSEEAASRMAAYEAEREELEAALRSAMEEEALAFLLTPATPAPPARHRSGPNSFAAHEIAGRAADAAGEGDLVLGFARKEWLPMVRGTYTGEPTRFTFQLLDLNVPSIAMRTAARHTVDGTSLPAGILLWGAPKGDRRLLEQGMALEAQLSAMVGAA